MGDITDEIVRKTENLEIEEGKFEKWNELPPEIKLECIKNLDFMTRWNLRNTSKTERNLVNSQKFKINEMIMEFCFFSRLYFILREKENSLDQQRNVDMEKSIEFVNFILQHAIFENIYVNRYRSVDKMIECFSANDFISVRKLLIECQNMKKAIFWIEKTNDRLENIEIKVNSVLDSDEILSEKKITNARFIQIIGPFPVDTVSKLAQIWMSNDGELGKKFQGHLIGSEDFAGFVMFGETFSNAIISKTDRMIRIRTSDEKKHILLELGTSTFGCLNGTEEFLRMTVIPSKMKESEYDTSGEWIRVLAEREENEPWSSDDEDAFYDNFFRENGYHCYDYDYGRENE